MDKQRLSSWLIRQDISKKEEIWLHGYTGAVDIVEKDLIASPSEDVKSQMIDKGYLTDKTAAEEQEHFSSLVSEIEGIEPDGNVYVLQLTIACNFACAYCSENAARRIKGHKEKIITQEHLANIRKVISTCSRDTSKDKLVLFGGEPLLLENSEIVIAVVDMFKQIEMNNMEVITNGYNVDAFIDLFDGIDCTFQVTLDGTKDVHDKRRVEKHTRRSYDKITKNVLVLLDRGHVVYLRMNVDHNNKEDIPDLFDEFAALSLDGNQKFKPYFGYTHDYGKYENQSKSIDLYHYFSEFESIERFGISRDPCEIERTLEHSITEDAPFKYKATHCGANKGNMLMFAPDGKIHTCWDAMPTDNEVGNYYPDISWSRDVQEREWLSRTINNIPECKKCKYALFCAGGCQYMAKNSTGSYFSPYCNGFQSVFNDVLAQIGRKL
uniref:Radical SAM core domain-containing protein n=1 Tax=Candidatus Kentrum sp. UNK TaxID=2126344 RepID=A0A451B568_9GAMM|nr:MAG: uncharacterized protein BECKUNK1418G_GA0071005_12065 [Candidatus Kentron sp. UNK]VFK73438.1 MAG: uncharacterized protein BECKUNK1418H_GA0071006_12025 [Candidatus Kentron sp. UNK]